MHLTYALYILRSRRVTAAATRAPQIVQTTLKGTMAVLIVVGNRLHARATAGDATGHTWDGKLPSRDSCFSIASQGCSPVCPAILKHNCLRVRTQLDGSSHEADKCISGRSVLKKFEEIWIG